MVDNPAAPVDRNEPPVCTADRAYCFAFRQNANAGFDLVLDPKRDGAEPKVLASAEVDREDDVSLWPQLIRYPMISDVGENREAFLVGLQIRRSTMYSGGGASSTQRRLFRVVFVFENDPLSNEVFAMPIDANKMIRACFSEQDYKDRRGACHDEYTFDATLTPVPGSAGPDPIFKLSVHATTAPGHVSLNEDSTRGKLKRSDLGIEDDVECTYTRTLMLNPATDRYEFDRPGPDCSEFTVL